MIKNKLCKNKIVLKEEMVFNFSHELSKPQNKIYYLNKKIKCLIRRITREEFFPQHTANRG